LTYHKAITTGTGHHSLHWNVAQVADEMNEEILKLRARIIELEEEN
jgi:hypothetical protein